MNPIEARPLPTGCLLARHSDFDKSGSGRSGSGSYTDCFTVDVPRKVTLPGLITAFYNAPAFRPERWILHLIGKGSNGEGVRALAAGEVQQFAAWNLVGRTETEILLQDFQSRTCSWLCAEPLATTAPTIKGRTRLYFGSGVRHPGSASVKALMPFHRFYAQTLLGSAAKRLLSISA